MNKNIEIIEIEKSQYGATSYNNIKRPNRQIYEIKTINRSEDK